MDRISELSDELLIKILLLLPTKDAVSTSILSKRWECLWMWLPKLEFVTRHPLELVLRHSEPRSKSLPRFLNKAMSLHRAPVIESFRLDLAYENSKPEDVRMWVVVALSRYLRELDISYTSLECKKDLLPYSLYASKSLVVLKLKGDIILDVPHRRVSLPSLKTLELQLTEVYEEALGRLLSICPLLEHLSIVLCDYECNCKIGKIIFAIPSLQSLSLTIPFECTVAELEIDTPCLKYLKFEDLNAENNSSVRNMNMPNLEEAYVNVQYPNMTSMFGAITSVKRLTIRCELPYDKSLVFNQLENLKLCSCPWNSYILLGHLLRDSPNLQVLDISLFEDHTDTDSKCLWNEPRTVPACLVSTLETLSWSGYMGRVEDISVAVYILQNANRLKTASFVSDDTIESDETFTPKLEILKALSRSSRASTMCELKFH